MQPVDSRTRSDVSARRENVEGLSRVVRPLPTPRSAPHGGKGYAGGGRRRTMLVQARGPFGFAGFFVRGGDGSPSAEGVYRKLRSCRSRFGS